MKTQYAKIGKAYAKAQGERIARKYMYEPSFFATLGNLEGKDILDLGCGSGIITRKLKRNGAWAVTGVDQEPVMIGLAKREEQKRPLEIEYSQGRVGDMSNLTHYNGNFSLATSFFLLHYAKTKQELEEMCQDISSKLAPHGRLVALNNNPENPYTRSKKYGATSTGRSPLVEGGKVHVRIWKDKKVVAGPFTTYHWKKETYEEALLKAGFKEIKWQTPVVSKAGIKKFGEEFWQDWYKTPYLTILEARK